MIGRRSYIRKLDSAARVVLPREYLRKIGMETKSYVELTVDNDKIIIKSIPSESSEQNI